MEKYIIDYKNFNDSSDYYVPNKNLYFNNSKLNKNFKELDFLNNAFSSDTNSRDYVKNMLGGIDLNEEHEKHEFEYMTTHGFFRFFKFSDEDRKRRLFKHINDLEGVESVGTTTSFWDMQFKLIFNMVHSGKTYDELVNRIKIIIEITDLSYSYE